jgi:hypothetical protein
MFRYLTLAVLILSGSSVYACDGVLALSGGCYSQNIRQRIVVERQVVPQYQIVERVVEQPVYVQRVEKIVERQRAYPLRSSLKASARVVERLAAPRAKVIRRERVVERLSY